MKIKKLIKESIIRDLLKETSDEIALLRNSILEDIIREGVDDPGILKIIFMAGGPGSGKSFTANEIFGVDKAWKASFSATGLKVVNSDTAFETELKKNGIDSKQLGKIEKENPELWGKIAMNPDSLRNKAKKLTKLQQSFYEQGRLGMIIDGTGKDYNKVKAQKQRAESLGYDTYMIFVNTSLEVALERNRDRDRVLSEDSVTEMWKEVQNNLGKFKGLFGGHFDIVDNTIYGPSSASVTKAANRFVSKPVENPIGKSWIQTARALKNANLIKK